MDSLANLSVMFLSMIGLTTVLAVFVGLHWYFGKRNDAKKNTKKD
jgi:hypothetical protein